MKNAYRKDIWRSIRKNMKRFLAIMLIAALGITVLTGIYAACMDMRYSADRFYDQQQLFDIRIYSTLGLTAADLTALQEVDGVAAVTGGFSETVYTEIDELRQTAEISVIDPAGMNAPYLEDGRIPQQSGEIAVTQKYLDESGKTVGETITIAEKQETDTEAEVTPSFTRTEFTITGIVIDPQNTANEETGNAFRATADTDYLFFVTNADVETAVYTVIYIIVEDAAELNCFTEQYKSTVKAVVDKIEAEIKNQREQQRYDEVRDDAVAEIETAEREMNEEFAKADLEFADAWSEWEDGLEELIDGENTLTDKEAEARSKLAQSRAEIASAKEQLTAAENELSAGEEKQQQGVRELAENKALLLAEQQTAETGFTQAEQLLAEKETELTASQNQLLASLEPLRQLFGEGWPEAAWNQLVSAAAAQTAAQLADNPDRDPDPEQIAAQTQAEQIALTAAVLGLNDSTAANELGSCIQSALSQGIISAGQKVLAVSKNEFEQQRTAARQQLEAAAAELAAGEAQINDGYLQLQSGWAEIAAAREQLTDGETLLNQEEQKALTEIADAWSVLAEGRVELTDGRLELIENEQKYQTEKEDAQQEIAEAYQDLEELDMAQWYVQERQSVESYSGLKNDLSSIEAVGTVFPVVFLLVAMLVSLTTMTRLVEEERGLIGTYKALGFSNGAIYRKYLLYALAASLLGGILGDILGFAVLPVFLLSILEQLYIIPQLTLHFDKLYGIGGVLLFVVGIVGAAASACRHELKDEPAQLMRPKAPRAGSRVLLERLPFLWKRLNFLHKVTARNLFRYKKRLLMTVGGIMGCTALVLTGFAIKDSVDELMPKQYRQTYRYDLLTAAASEDNEQLIKLLDQNEAVTDYLNVQIENATVINVAGDSESVQLFVVPTDAQLDKYISTVDAKGTAVDLGDQGILLTRSAAEILQLESGDVISIQKQNLDQEDVIIDQVVENYLGNNIYISQQLYESIFATYEPNAVFANLSGTGSSQQQFAEQLLEVDFVLSAVSTQSLRDDFGVNFTMINSVLYLLILLAAGLAFVVLFTLSNTNISERERELATIKVLGFYDPEVYTYVNNETLILTAIGVLAGLPVGRFVSGLLTLALKMPGIYFAVAVKPQSYLIAAVISFSFALIVNVITNRTLNRINMVEALKSVE